MPAKLEKIGRYEIVSECGRGAMGIVYKGHDPSIDRFVAIKTLGLNMLDVDSGQLEDRFRTEAKAAGRLTHPNIISIYEFGEEADQAFIAMEYVEGCTLSELEKGGKLLEVSEILQIMQKVLDALQYAHEHGVVHRDIKPSNIMYTPDGEVKVADFGIARLESSTQTQFGTVIGTPGYMSPEQIMGQRVDSRTDIFSAGILLYELLTGERAFVSTNITSTTYKVVNTELPPPSKLCPTVPEAIDAILARALAKHPDNRFQSAREFAQALGAVRMVGIPSAGGHAPVPTGDDTVVQPRTGTTTNTGATVLATSTVPGSHPQATIGSGVTNPPDLDFAANAEREVSGVSDVPDHPASGMTDTGQIPVSAEADFVAPPVAARSDRAARAGGTGYRWVAGVGLALVVAVALLLVMLWFTFMNTRENSAGTSHETADMAPAETDTRQVNQQFPRGKVFNDCITCPTMIVIPPGSFLQGTAEGESERELNESPLHSVNIDYPLAVGIKEITRGQYSRFVLETGYTGAGCWGYDGGWKKNQDLNWLSPGFFQDDNHPVTCISWKDAQAYISWLTAKTGNTYRLLSESEWEYATRAGATTARNWGDDPAAACKAANVADIDAENKYPGWEVHDCTDGYISTAPAGSFAANPFGLYDTLGNIFEWVEDCWHDSYEGSPVDGTAWSDGVCDRRVLRGGSWYSRPVFVRSAYRNRFPPDHRSSSFGFRVARELEAG